MILLQKAYSSSDFLLPEKLFASQKKKIKGIPFFPKSKMVVFSCP